MFSSYSLPYANPQPHPRPPHLTSDQDDDTGTVYVEDSPVLTLVLKLSASSKSEAQQWIDSLTQGCALVELRKEEQEQAQIRSRTQSHSIAGQEENAAIGYIENNVAADDCQVQGYQAQDQYQYQGQEQGKGKGNGKNEGKGKNKGKCKGDNNVVNMDANTKPSNTVVTHITGASTDTGISTGNGESVTVSNTNTNSNDKWSIGSSLESFLSLPGAVLRRVKSSKLLLERSSNRQEASRKIVEARSTSMSALNSLTETDADVSDVSIGNNNADSIVITNKTRTGTDIDVDAAFVLSALQEQSGLRNRKGKASQSISLSSSLSSASNLVMPTSPRGSRNSCDSGNDSGNGTPKKQRVMKEFPGSKPMHIKAQPSPLSNDTRPGEMNYRGFFNLAALVFILSHLNIVVISHQKFGFVPAWTKISAAVYETNNLFDWAYSKPGLSLLSWLVQLLLHWSMESYFVSARCSLSESTILGINFIFGGLNLIVPTIWCWYSDAHWGGRMLYLFQSVIIWMKLTSYAHANRDMRILYKSKGGAGYANCGGGQLQLQRKSSSNSLVDRDSNIDDLKGAGAGDASLFTPIKLERVQSTGTVLRGEALRDVQQVKDLKPPFLHYPQNLSFNNLLYFSVAPTLCYQLNYPQSPTIRKKHLFTLLIRMMVISGLILYGAEQYIKPPVMSGMQAMDDMDIFGILQTLLRVSIPNTYVWLLGFYFYFHLWLNFLGEITYFGDRGFYKDWWNACTIETYWRNWNLPVHHWMLRHMYYPLTRAGVSRTVATFVIFFFSAFFHELIISVPFRHVSMHAFYGMLAQAPLTYVTRKFNERFNSAFFGNIIFWCVFCVVGQPCGIILIAYDHWKLPV